MLIIRRKVHHRVSFFDGRIDKNPGIFLLCMTIEDVKQGVSKIQSRVLARVFRVSEDSPGS